MAAAEPDRRHLICRGMPIVTPFEVLTWEHHGMRFFGKHRIVTRAVCLHWTASENLVSQMYQHMISGRSALTDTAPLSVHFAIDQRGTIYQLADTELRGAHAPGHEGNSWTIGIEIIGRGSADPKKVPSKGWARARIKEHIQGRVLEYDEVLSEQVEACLKLVEFLCTLYGLPLEVPLDTDGVVFAALLDRARAERFRGVLGHCHLQAGKDDPGLRILRAVHRRGRELRDSVT